MNRQVILIGGAPTVGKSTLAKKIAQELGLPWISTDQIRGVLKSVADRQKYPELFHSTGLTAEEFLTQYSASEVAKMEYDQATEVWPGVRALIDNDSDWQDGCVVEGVNIVPHLVHRDYANSDVVKAIFVCDDDAEQIRQVVFDRGLYGAASTYSDSVKDTEVEWVGLFNTKIKNEADRYGYPCVERTKNEIELPSVLNIIDKGYL